MIKVWDYLQEYAAEKNEIHEAIDRVLKSGQLILGEEVKKFESAFAAYCGAAHGIGVNSGTDAIFLALKALGVGTGDEVITVANTAVPTVSAIQSTGAKAVFVDIRPGDYLMDVSQIEMRITNKTKCIVAVHLFGQCIDMKVVQDLAHHHGLKVIEDCAQSHGALYGDKMAGSMSDISAFSFYPTKILGGFGDAGLILTSDGNLAKELRKLRFYGMEQVYYAEGHGYNSRLDELHAAILSGKLRHMDHYLARRRSIAAKYDHALAGSSLVLPVQNNHGRHAYYLYVVRHLRRDEWLEALKQRDIHLNVSYRWPIHTMRGYAHLGYKEGDLPQTESAAREIFSLPMYPSLGDEEQERVIAALLDIDKSLA